MKFFFPFPGCVPLPETLLPFFNSHKIISTSSLLGDINYIAALQKYNSDIDVRKLTLIDTELSTHRLPISLGTFIETQNLHQTEVLCDLIGKKGEKKRKGDTHSYCCYTIRDKQVSEFIKSDWILKIIHILEDLTQVNSRGDSKTLSESEDKQDALRSELDKSPVSPGKRPSVERFLCRVRCSRMLRFH